MTAMNFGALGFGLIIGWYIYYINRYRKGDVQIGDITTLVAAIGGAAVLALFPKGSDLFGFYGIGLAIGFFAYFVTLIILVRVSDNFDADWFLDGRRRDPGPGVSIPSGARPNVTAMTVNSPPTAGFHGQNPGSIQQFFYGAAGAPALGMPAAMGVRPEPAPKAMLSTAVCQAIVFAETATIELTKDSTASGLAEARRFIAAVAYKRNGAGVAKPRYPTADELKQPFIKAAWDNCKTAADAAVDDDVGDCRHFVIWYSDDAGRTPSKSPKAMPATWPYDYANLIKQSWGPYKVNELGASNIYVIKYCGVP